MRSNRWAVRLNAITRLCPNGSYWKVLTHALTKIGPKRTRLNGMLAPASGRAIVTKRPFTGVYSVLQCGRQQSATELYRLCPVQLTGFKLIKSYKIPIKLTAFWLELPCEQEAASVGCSFSRASNYLSRMREIIDKNCFLQINRSTVSNSFVGNYFVCNWSFTNFQNFPDS